jgi:hypothetical protein
VIQIQAVKAFLPWPQISEMIAAAVARIGIFGRRARHRAQRWP